MKNLPNGHRPKVYKKSADTKLKIIDAALECFAAEGLARTTIASIANKCAISPSLVFYHFHDIDELFLHVVTKVIQDSKKILDLYESQAISSRERVLGIVDGMFDWIALSPKRQSIMIQFYHECIFKAQFRTLHHAGVTQSNERMATALRTSAEFADKVKADACAEAIQNMVSGALLRIASQENTARIPQVRRLCHEQSLRLAGFV